MWETAIGRRGFKIGEWSMVNSENMKRNVNRETAICYCIKQA